MAGESRRDLIYRMRVDAEQAKAEWAKAGGATRALRYELRQLEQQQQAVDNAMTVLGQGMAVSGAAIGLGLGLAAKAAIEWESAWTGVAKVVDGTPEQMAALEEELRGLATTLPQTHAEIAGVAAAAGQLGIAREDISEFTQVMVAMGVSTNLASEEAATALARMMNIMSTAPEDVDKLGSAIVALGNSSATTEAEIVEMALRIAGAGETVGMTEAEVLGFAAALSSVGIEAESGGTAISTAMIKISEAVNEGGESLETFAEVAGVTADEFSLKFRQDPAAAIDMFVRGLGRIESSGGNVFAVLESLGLSEIRLRDALLRLANAGDVLTASIETGNAAWDENSALIEEAARRYGTTEAQMQIARNQLVDLGITLGEILLPAIRTLLDVGSGLMSFFQDLPAPVQQLVVWLGLGAAAIGLLGGAALIAVPKIHALNVALGDMGGKKAGMAQKALGRVTSFLGGPWGLAIGAAVTILGIFAAKQAESRARVDELSSTLDEQTSAVTGNTRAWIANDLEASGALETAQKLGIPLETLVDAILGEKAALTEVNAVLDEHKSELELTGETVGGTVPGVETLTGKELELAQAIQSLTGELDSAKGAHERKTEAVGADASASESASAAANVLAENLGITTGAAEEATSAFDKLEQQVRDLVDTAFALSGAQRDVEAGIDELTEKLAENGATIDANTDKGRENQQAIEDQITAIAQLAVTTAQQTGSAEEANAVLAEERQRLIEVMEAAGFTSDEINNYIGVLDSVPAEIETAIETSGVNAAIRSAEQIQRELDAIDRTVTISFQTRGFMPRGGVSIPGLADGGIAGYADGGITGFPDGGLFRGRGGPRSDSNIIAVSDGEFIVNAAATKQHRALLEAINSGRHIGAAMSRSAARAPMSSGGDVRVHFDFSGVSDSMARAIRDTVKIEGDGNVQVAFGSR